MFLANVLDIEVINYKREMNGALIVLPEAWNQFALSVAMLVASFFRSSLDRSPACSRPFIPRIDVM